MFEKCAKRCGQCLYVALIGIVVVTVGCSQSVGTIGLASNKYFVPAKYDLKNAERVYSSGTSSHVVMFNYDIEPMASIQQAMNEAIGKVGGDFMTDAKVTETESGIIFLVGKRTITVEGQVYKLPPAAEK
jgi:hypothetical protein